MRLLLLLIALLSNRGIPLGTNFEWLDRLLRPGLQAAELGVVVNTEGGVVGGVEEGDARDGAVLAEGEELLGDGLLALVGDEGDVQLVVVVVVVISVLLLLLHCVHSAPLVLFLILSIYDISLYYWLSKY